MCRPADRLPADLGRLGQTGLGLRRTGWDGAGTSWDGAAPLWEPGEPHLPPGSATAPQMAGSLHQTAGVVSRLTETRSLDDGPQSGTQSLDPDASSVTRWRNAPPETRDSQPLVRWSQGSLETVISGHCLWC